MQGITILTSEYINNTGTIIIFIILAMMCIGAISFGFFMYKESSDSVDGFICGTSIAAGICGLILLIITATHTNFTNYTKYMGTIDKTTSYIEFIEKYELIEQKDNLFIFKDKTT